MELKSCVTVVLLLTPKLTMSQFDTVPELGIVAYLPYQVIVLPALLNEFITLVKETAVGAYIGIMELTKASDIIASRTYDYFFPLILIALIYLLITYLLSKLVNRVEVKINATRS